MNSFAQFLLDYFPWWGIPIALIMFETSNYFRRIGQRMRALFFAVIGLFFTILVIVYIYNGGFGFLVKSFLDK